MQTNIFPFCLNRMILEVFSILQVKVKKDLIDKFIKKNHKYYERKSSKSKMERYPERR